MLTLAMGGGNIVGDAVVVAGQFVVGLAVDGCIGDELDQGYDAGRPGPASVTMNREVCDRASGDILARSKCVLEIHESESSHQTGFCEAHESRRYRRI